MSTLAAAHARIARWLGALEAATGRRQHVEQVDAVLAEDDRTVVAYVYAPDDACLIIGIDLPHVIGPAAFDPLAWEVLLMAGPYERPGRLH